MEGGQLKFYASGRGEGALRNFRLRKQRFPPPGRKLWDFPNHYGALACVSRRSESVYYLVWENQVLMIKFQMLCVYLCEIIVMLIHIHS